MDRLIDGEQVAARGWGWGLRDGGIEEKGLMDMDNSVVIAEEKGV